MKKYAITLLFAGIFVFCAGVLSPVSALAAHKNLTCADFTTYSGNISAGNCSGSTLTIPPISGSPSYGWAQTGALGFNTNYVTYTTSGSGTGTFMRSDFTIIGHFTTSAVDTALSGADSVFTVDHESPYLFQGSISDICVSDTLGECAGGTTSSSTSPFAAFSTTTVYTVVDNPTQDFANGVWFFLAGLFGMVYFFSKKR